MFKGFSELPIYRKIKTYKKTIDGATYIMSFHNHGALYICKSIKDDPDFSTIEDVGQGSFTFDASRELDDEYCESLLLKIILLV